MHIKQKMKNNRDCLWDKIINISVKVEIPSMSYHYLALA